MSCWTSACVKFVLAGRVSVAEFQRIVGKECDPQEFEEEKIAWENQSKYLPIGSEGTLHIYPDSASSEQTTYIVLGNLRDRWSTEYITEWFNRVVQHPRVLQATGNTSLDSGLPIPLTYTQPQ